jgi:hypothetical protein
VKSINLILNINFINIFQFLENTYSLKENDGGSEFHYDIRTFGNVTMYPQYNNNMIIKKNILEIVDIKSCIRS